MKKFIDRYGRKFAFAICVMFFVVASITLNTFLLCFGKITADIFKELFVFCGGFITLLATTYFFANAKSKQYYNEDVSKLRKEIEEGNE